MRVTRAPACASSHPAYAPAIPQSPASTTRTPADDSDVVTPSLSPKTRPRIVRQSYPTLLASRRQIRGGRLAPPSQLQQNVRDAHLLPNRNFAMIVATAGHVGHGKTTLLRALTGVDADRLPGGKTHGMSIDLGFAYWRPPGTD